ncbi:hypothetical protein [uncultured Campylobacter sp.]|uniref:vWA domain-containing protein n=1 Tax=uncultured Campylobacter sp. TaxID=218934 RepID=UPI0028E6054B|nr:hypothetical protein [uncultured Campylobacter sp.]
MPSELGLTDGDTQILFDIKFIENKLICFENISTEKTRVTDKILYNADANGPIILCVDFSGSMYGIPEAATKAIVKRICDMARVENRQCYILGHNPKFIKIDLSGRDGILNLVKFCCKSFSGGGIDITSEVIEKALDIIKIGGQGNADILVISDMIFPVTARMKAAAQEIKKGGSKIYALIIADDKFEPDEIFDAAWQRKNRENVKIFEVRFEK